MLVTYHLNMLIKVMWYKMLPSTETRERSTEWQRKYILKESPANQDKYNSTYL